MNMNGVERRGACGFKSGGMVLHNPCRHIRVAHWHCDSKTHGKHKVDQPQFMLKINQTVAINQPKFGMPLSEFQSCGVFHVADSCLSTGGEEDCGGIYLGPL